MIVTTILEGSFSQTPQTVIRCLNEGGIAILPSHGNYVITASAHHPQAIERIYAVKKRDRSQALGVCIGRIHDAWKYGNPPANFKKLAERFWPGPTIFIIANRSLPEYVTAGLKTIAITMPETPLFLDIAWEADFPLVGTSANLSGSIPTGINNFSLVIEQLGAAVDLVVHDNSARYSDPNVIIDLTLNPPVLVRPGPVAKSAYEQFLGPLSDLSSDYTAYLDHQRHTRS